MKPEDVKKPVVLRLDRKNTIEQMLEEFKAVDPTICVVAGFNDQGEFFIGADSDSSRADMCYILQLMINDLMGVRHG